MRLKLHSRKLARYYNRLDEDFEQELSRNFLLSEFDIDQATADYYGVQVPDVILVDPALVAGLQAIREAVGFPIQINSAYRTRELHNAIYAKENLGEAPPKSAHLFGLAADIAASLEGASLVDLGVANAQILDAAEDLDFGGIGQYWTTTRTKAGEAYSFLRFIHVDVWGDNRRWNG